LKRILPRTGTNQHEQGKGSKSSWVCSKNAPLTFLQKFAKKALSMLYIFFLCDIVIFGYEAEYRKFRQRTLFRKSYTPG